MLNTFGMAFGCPANLRCDHHFAVGKIIKVFFIKSKEPASIWESQKPFIVLCMMLCTFGLSHKRLMDVNVLCRIPPEPLCFRKPLN